MLRFSIIALFIASSFVSLGQNFSFVGPGLKVDPYAYKIVKSDTFSNAAVSSAHPLASMAGAEVMRLGGNAFDAAITTQLVLAVVYPNAGNLGGGGFLLGRTKKGKLVGLDYREMAPGAANRDMYLDEKGQPQTQKSQLGHLASGVPGTVAGLFATLPYAKLKMEQLIQPAIDIAEKGFVITEREANGLNGQKNDFNKYNTRPTAFIKDKPWKAGDTLFQPELAATLKRIQQKGQAGFYEGETAQLIVEEMKRGNGIISLEDLKKYIVRERAPLQFKYRGYDIISFAPPSSGGLLLGQMLKMVEPFDLNKFGFHSSAAVQVMIEAERRAYADRAEHMGDPDFWKVPTKTLLSDSYLQMRMQDFEAGKASVSKQIKAGWIAPGEETTHLSVVDADGNLVAVTTTLNGSYGSKTVVGGAGFLMNNEMDDFSIKPGVPNMYGAVGGEANAIVPRKRMLSSMTPTLMVYKKQPWVTIGTPGGTTIPTSIFQAVVNLVDFNMSLSDAINQSKFHHQWLPDEVMVERDFPSNTIEELKKMGYTITPRSPIGRTEGIRIIGKKKLETVADKRGDDSVAGY
jgi:gamma-glutamyltranspeptidase/glutathione hydrolase